MAKIDYTKVEERLSQTLHSMFIKKLMGSEPSVSIRAVTYYGMGDGPRPKREDPVESTLTEIREDARKELLEEASKQAEKTQPKEVITKPVEVPKEQPIVPLNVPVIEKVPVIEDKLSPTAPLLILKKHLDWLKKNKVKDRYKLIGTTKEEIEEIYKKDALTEENQKRVDVILKKAEELKAFIVKNSGLDDDNKLVEQERKKHINKRHNVRPTWIPLQ